MAACGSDAGYQQHRARRQVPCQVCCDAHAADMAWHRRQAVADNPLLYAKARAGREPAEVLSTADRARLVTELHRRGWTDVQIAEHTRMSTYTTARIRGRLDLSPNTTATRTRRRTA